LITAQLYSQGQPEQSVPPDAPVPAEQKPDDPSPATTSPEPVKEIPPSPPQAPLVWNPAPPPPPAKPKAKVVIDSRGRRVRASKKVQSSDPSNGKSSIRAEESEFKIRTDVELVLLDVSVKDSRGGFVSGLPKDVKLRSVALSVSWDGIWAA
jgi:hypothetical protein